MASSTPRFAKALIAVIVALAGVAAQQPAAQRALSPVTDAMLQKPSAADWLMWRRALDSWGYSPLDSIDRSNVASSRSSGRVGSAAAFRNVRRSCTTA